jgi:hypothetical protein
MIAREGNKTQNARRKWSDGITDGRREGIDLVVCLILPVYIKQFGLTKAEGGTGKALLRRCAIVWNCRRACCNFEDARVKIEWTSPLRILRVEK